MTDQMKNKLKDLHKEKLDDHVKYMELSEELRKDGFHKASGILKDIADEEEMHAQLIAHILDFSV